MSRFAISRASWRWLAVCAAALVTLAAIWRTVRTYANLRSDLEELLPSTAPSVGALATLRARMPAVRYLGVVVDTGGPKHLQRANRFVDALRSRIVRYPSSMVAGVQIDLSKERRFAETYALQLMDPSDVRRLREAVKDRHDWEVTHALGMDLLDEEEDPPPQIPLTELLTKYENRYGAQRTGTRDRFVSEDGRTAVLLVRAASHSTSYEADAALLRRVRADVASLDASGLRVGYAGDVATRVEEMEGLVADLTVSGLLAAVGVLLAVRWFFGNLWSVVLLGLPLVLGMCLTLGLVALPPLGIRHLNSNTGFLASVIIGNGVNFGIILLARFAEERQRGLSTSEAIPVAVRATWPATLAAAAAAATAYGSLVFTDFRGFNQFGWIGGVGMLTCWATTYLLAPHLLGRLGDRFGRSTTATARPGWGHRAVVGALQRPTWVLAGTAFLALVAGAGLVERGNDWLEQDLSQLRRRDSSVDGERYWGHRMDETLHRYLTPTVIMTGGARHASTIRDRVLEVSRGGGAGGLVGSVKTAADLLPPARLAALAEARTLKAALTPRLLGELSPEERRLVDASLGEAAQRPLTADQIPDTLAAGLRENTGRMDRNVLVFPRLSGRTWDGPSIHEFTRDLRDAASVDPTAQVAGSLPLSSDITDAMRHDGPRATAFGLVAALVICLVAFGSLRRSLWAMATLLVGVLLMMGCLGWTGQRLNFSNFVVLPITFGVSADYAINVLRRHQVEGSVRAPTLLANTAGAVGLCSATTIIGFGSLLAAQNQALYSFGVFAATGEIAALVTATLALPACLAVRERFAKHAEVSCPSH
jgi:predicted RND superfamily exporter protein